jgi:hypothetical protein
MSYYNDSTTGKPYTLHNYSVGWQTVPSTLSGK